MRNIVNLLNYEIPVIAGCEINDHPFHPVCRRCRELLQEKGDQLPVTWKSRDERYTEKLATPDVTIADLIGEVDPIKVAEGRYLAGEPTAHSEGGKLYFQFPPHPRTLAYTLEEVKRCTREGIVIHTFMMLKSNPLTNFVVELTKINQGQAYFADSDHLGEYIIVNYLDRKRM